MKKLVCNYSVIRFLPYPETEEFVNVGILACCPQIGWINFIVEARKTKRINDFFPELDPKMFISGRQHLIAELKRLVAEHHLANHKQWVLTTDQQYIAALFAEIVRPREELFRFGSPATLLTENPEKDLTNLFDHYVERHFAKHRDYQETIMTHRLTDLFKERNLLARYRNEKVGTDEYHVTLPFVEKRENNPRPIRAVKPLNLAQTEATQIRNHGDMWRLRVERLHKMHILPEHMLFAVQLPPKREAKRFDAAQEICSFLREQDVVVENFENKAAVTQFAECN